jgi:Integrase core domain
LEELLSDWEFYYNRHRPHSSLDGKTPQEKHIELLYKTPFWEDIGKMFDFKNVFGRKTPKAFKSTCSLLNSSRGFSCKQ